MSLLSRVGGVVVLLLLIIGVESNPRRIVVDTDVDTDDLFALLYLLKLNQSQFRLEVLTTSTLTSIPSSSFFFFCCC